MKRELKIALVMDDYKLPDKDKWWKRALDKTPEIRDNYDLVKEEQCRGLSPDTTIVTGFFKLREN